jgi:hypothetical protein
MAGNTYVVRLIDCDKDTKSGVGGDADAVRTLLTTWYAAVCQQASSWSADVKWLDNPPVQLPGQDPGSPFVVNMILFFVLTPMDSVIKLYPAVPKNFLAEALKDPTTVGQTINQNVTGGQPIRGISEVYVTRCRLNADQDPLPLKLARTGFHESMHNQLNLGDALHKGRTGFAASVPTGDSPNAVDLKLMADRLGTLIPQWLDGFQAWKSNSTSLTPI